MSNVDEPRPDSFSPGEPEDAAVPDVPLGNQQGPYGFFRDTRRLRTAVVILLYANALGALLYGALSAYEWNLINEHGVDYFSRYDVTAPLFFSANATKFSTFETVQQIVSAIFAIISLATVVCFAIWVNKTCKNAWLFRPGRLFRPGGLEITPGWAVGWYFIPIASLWKPYQSMREIRDASCQPGELARLLPWWWALWLTFNILNYVSSRLVMSETMGVYKAGNLFEVCITPLNILSAILALMVVKGITRAQFEKIGQPA